MSISSLSTISQQKIDALHCHLTLELSLQHKHHILQTKLAQLNQLQSITDELIHLNTLIKRDMSNGHSYLEYLRQLKTEQKQIICDWKKLHQSKSTDHSLASNLFSSRPKYSTMMKQEELCSMNDNRLFSIKTQNESIFQNYDCRPRENGLTSNEESHSQERSSFNTKQDLISCKLN